MPSNNHTDMDTTKRLEELRTILRSESMSYDELHELQSLAAHIAPDDVELLEAAGVPEQQESGMDTQKLKADFGTIRWDGERLMGIAPDFAPQMVRDPIVATNATPHNAAELVKRWNAYPDLVEKLRMIALAHDLAPKSTPANLRRTVNDARTLLATLKA